MNVSNRLRGAAAIRYLILIIAALAVDALCGFAVPLGIFAILAVVVPLVIRQAAHIWAAEVEWTKLGVTEDYATAAHKKMAEQFRHQLRESLDPIGQEAYDEVQRAIERNQEDQANG
jgi:hypothetical protein